MLGRALLLLLLAGAPRPSAEQLTDNASSALAWAGGRVAFDPADCPCSTAMRAHGEALPDFARLFSRVLQPGDLAVVVGTSSIGPISRCVCV
jgi:hypothetical protein